MPRTIERVRLRGFRGATGVTELRLDPTKPIAVIFGENGTGKSTIVDGIDAVCNRSAGSLADRSSTTARQHLAAVGQTAGDLFVELSSGPATWRATFGGKGIEVGGVDPPRSASPKLNSALPAMPADRVSAPPVAYVLRRRQLLRLVEARPAERYEALRRFIDVAGVEASEQSLRAAERSSAKRLDEALRRRDEAEAALQELWEAEGSPGAPHTTALSWAASKATSDVTAIETALARLEDWLRHVDRALAAVEAARQAADEAERWRDELAAVEAAATDAEPVSGATRVELVGLLRTAQAYLTERRPDTCPVCEQSVAAARLGQAIGERLEALTALTALHERLTSVKREQWRSETALRRSWEVAVAAARQVSEVRGDPEGAIGAAAPFDWGAAASSRRVLAEVERSAPTQRAGAGSLSPLRVPVDAADPAPTSDSAAPSAAPRELGAATASLARELAAHRETIAPARDTLQRDVHQYNAIARLYANALVAARQVEEEEAIQRRLKRALAIAHEERLSFVQSVLDLLAGECARLYAQIHPDEPLGLARFALDERTRGSLHQFAEFQGHVDVPPQAYFSESHLDTLGFCLFLALARRLSGGDGILVLDDVFTSVDGRHLTRIAKVIVEQLDCFAQIILTMHQRNWRDYFDRVEAYRAQTQLVDPAPWSLEAGIRLEEAR